MSCVTVNCNKNLTLDPYKRVCYSQGMVLGVDEFVQEEIYFLEQHRWHNRGLHGYGAVCGLAVEVRDTSADGPEIVVSPGMALDPKGRRIRVDEAQCALLNEWLRRFADDLVSPAGAGSPPSVSLFLRLCYRECSTDRVPIPSGPCRSADETSVPSRVLDSFRLELTTTAPDQTEADTVREFAHLLRSIEFSDIGPATLTQEDLENLVRALGPASPPVAVPVPPGSPPDAWRVSPADAEEYLRAAFRVWVTEVRPILLPDGGACAGGPPKECCILLGQVDFPVVDAPAGLAVDGDASVVAIDQTARPYLLHTQLLQELFLGGAFVPSPPGVEDHGDLLGLGEDDHAQYLLVDPTTRALIADLDADGNRVVNLSNGAALGDAMPVGQPIPAAADLSGTLPGPRVVRLQGRDVADINPNDADVLTWVQGNNRWEPRPVIIPPSPPGDTNFEPDLVRIFALSWTHGVAQDLFFRLDDKTVRGLAVAFGRKVPGDAKVQIGVVDSGGHFIDRGSLDDFSFQVFFEQGPTGAVSRQRIVAGDIIPIEPLVTPGSPLFVAGKTVPGPYPDSPLITAAGALLIPSEIVPQSRYYIEITGDHVLDDDGEPRAIDAEMVRGQLPTGDRRRGSETGLQGGIFRSWFPPLRELDAGGRIDVNKVTFDSLVQLGFTESVSSGIMVFRSTQQGARVRNIDDLAAVSGVGNVTLDKLRESLTVGNETGS